MRLRALALTSMFLLALALPARAQAACEVFGTAGADNLLIQLTGNDNLVEICTLGGSDRVVIDSPTVPTENIKVVVTAGAGNDRVAAPAAFTGQLDVRGGPGNDIVQGGSGNDLLNGAFGADILRGGSGHDKLVGGPAIDRLFGQPGNDIIVSGPAKDRTVGGPGADKVDGRQEPFARIVKTCVEHVGPGESYLVIFLEGAPFAEFAETRIFPFTVGRLGPDGRAEVRVPINSYGDHTVTVIAPVFNRETTGDTQTVTVTANEDCFPDPD